MPLRVALAYTVEVDKQGSVANPHGTLQMNVTTEALKDAIAELGYEVHLVPGDIDMLRQLGEIRPDVIFNNCTGIHDKSSQPQVAAMLELARIPFTGSGHCAHVLALYKPLTKMVLGHHNIPTPHFAVADSEHAPLPSTLKYPVIVKPEHEGSSIGISAKSVANSAADAAEMVRTVVTSFRQPALVEEFVVGREFTVGVLGGERTRILPPIEIMFATRDGFYDHHVKSQDAVVTKCPVDLEPQLYRRMEEVVLGSFQALGCRDYARIDLRVTTAGLPYVIDVNTLPGLDPSYSDYPKAARAAGLSYVGLIDHLLHCALRRA
ncbi:MAG: ATP-grasp domain-containing protein [Firmicutes bacterium]|nr:ATP-grasp domain-containing protein [Dethiobacter sp.]MBS3888438.1 ATP-grasp domain-containing protein [Bacillota bacterium]